MGRTIKRVNMAAVRPAEKLKRVAAYARVSPAISVSSVEPPAPEITGEASGRPAVSVDAGSDSGAEVTVRSCCSDSPGSAD